MIEQAAVGSRFTLTANKEEHAERLLVSSLLRAEVRLLGMELKRKGLNQANNWGWLGAGSKNLKDRIDLIDLNEKLRLTDKGIAELPPRLVHAQCITATFPG